MKADGLEDLEGWKTGGLELEWANSTDSKDYGYNLRKGYIRIWLYQGRFAFLKAISS